MLHGNEVSGDWHESYELGRPSYPVDAIRMLGLDPSAVVLEVGAGTGKLTRVLLPEVGRVVAVEPDPAMRRWLVERCPTAEVVGSMAEALPVADRSVDAVVAAEAFHWFDHEAALDEVARVLRPAGTLALLWNRPDGSPEPAIAEVDELLEPRWPEEIERPLDLNPMRFAHARDWPSAVAASPFHPMEESRFANLHEVTADGLVAFFGSMGWISTLEDDERRALLGEVRSRLTGSEYRLPFETLVYRSRLPLD